MYFLFVLNFMHFYIERVSLTHTLFWLIHLQVLYIVLVFMLILLIFIIYSRITDIFKHVTFSLQVDFIWNSFNLSFWLLSPLTVSSLLLLGNGCLQHVLRFLLIGVKWSESTCSRWWPGTSSRWSKTLFFNLIRLVVVSNHMTYAHFLINEQILFLRFDHHVVLDRLNIHSGYFNVGYHVTIECIIVDWDWVMVIIKLLLRLLWILIKWLGNVLTFFIHWYQEVDRGENDLYHCFQRLLACTIVKSEDSTLWTVLVFKELFAN